MRLLGLVTGLSAYIILCWTGLVGPRVSANPPQRVRTVTVPAVNPFIATQFGQITIPTYGAAYNGQVSDDAIRELAAAIREFTATMKAMGNAPELTPPPKKAVDALSEGVTILQNRCAKCHDKAVSATKGGPNKFTLLDGAKLAPLTTDQALDCVLRIDDGSMPQGGNPLSDVETAKVFKMFRQMKANTVKGK